MNDSDRSVESMDFAMRRRFVWEEVNVDEKLLTEAFWNGRRKFFQPLAADDTVLKKVNAQITLGILDFNRLCLHDPNLDLGPGYDIAHGQFTGIRQEALLEELKPGTEYQNSNANWIAEQIMNWVWKYRVQPLLREYLRSDPDKKPEDYRKYWHPVAPPVKTAPEGSADGGPAA
jgi:5-methylcytosine-specific restriction protein B